MGEFHADSCPCHKCRHGNEAYETSPSCQQCLQAEDVNSWPGFSLLTPSEMAAIYAARIIHEMEDPNKKNNPNQR